MSKRSGDFVTLREVVDEVGRDAVRFMMLYRKNDARARFRPRQGDRAVARQSGVLCAVRATRGRQSVFRNAREVLPDLPPDAAATGCDVGGRRRWGSLIEPDEFALMRRLALYPRTVEAAALAHEPHRVAFYSI